MGLTRLAVTRPLAILMLILAIVLMGAVSYTKLKVDRFPNISFPAVFVSLPYAGAAPSDIEELMAKPVENAIAGLAGIDSITSTSSEGFLSVNIRFVEGTDTNQAALDVERRLASIRNRLPADIGAWSVTKADIQAIPVMNVAMSGKRPLGEIYTIATDSIAPRLQSVAGVADVTISGGLVREVQVKVDPDRLRAYGVTLQQVQTALQRENQSSPSGRLTEGTSSSTVRTTSTFRDVEDIRNTNLTAAAGGGVAATAQPTIRLRDVATIQDTFAEQTRIQRYNGQDAVGFTITKQADANGVQVADSITTALDQIKRTLPPDITMTVTSDTSRFTRRSLSAVMNDLYIGVMLTAIVLFLFLHTWRNTVIVLLAIPTSLISTFLVVYFMGFSLNIISLMALALTIGILVDDSIVVLENITRHLESGELPRDASLRGRSEIGMAAIAITLVDVIVFLPVSFMSGNIGRLFKEFGITIAAATLCSLFVSFTLTPMLASRWLKHHDGTEPSDIFARFGRLWDRGYDRIAAGYRRVLAVGLRVRWGVVLVGFATLAGTYSMLRFNIIGSEYAPSEDDGLFSINVTMPAGTALAGTDQVVRQIEQRLKQIPEVEGVFATVGTGGGFGGGSTASRSANINVQLKDKHNRQRSVFEIVAEANRILPRVPGAQIRALPPNNPLAGGGGAGINIRLLGDEMTKLEALASQVEDIVKKTPGAIGVQNNAQARDPEIRAVLDRERLMDSRINADTVAQSMRMMVSGIVVTQMRPESGTQVDVRLIGADNARVSAGQLAGVPFRANDGTIVRLDQIARLVNDAGPARIQRTDRQRVVEISAAVNPNAEGGRTLGDVVRDARAQTNQIALPEGYQLIYAGQVQQQEQAFQTLLQALTLSVLLVYMLMVALYESWLTPFAIMFSLPVALVGAFLGLFVTGNTFNIFSMIGMIMLMGLVGKNAILLIDFTDTLRKRGMERTEALLEAGYTRLRPIIMTTCTVVFAMLPLALKLEEGGESRAPLAVVLMGGVLSSTLLTLLLVPAVYTLLDDGKIQVGRLINRLRRGSAAPAHGMPVPVGVPRARLLTNPPPARGGAED
ncbi:MAG: efflux RND transporter permease subunit [Chloroflexota bacterium]